MMVAVDSVKKTGNMSLYWKWLNDNKTILNFTAIEAKQFEADNASRIYSKANGADLNVVNVYETELFYTGEIAFPDFVDMPRLDLAPLITELPNYMQLIDPPPKKVWLLEYQYVVRGPTVVQPLFKIVAVYAGRDNKQLMIMGRDRHTREPFCLGVPNGFAEHPIDAALRWTMDVHKGDIVEEI